MGYVNYMNNVCRLYELYELCKLYQFFYELLKIRLILLEFVLKIIFSVFQNFSKKFSRICKDGKSSYKNENIERKYLNNM